MPIFGRNRIIDESGYNVRKDFTSRINTFFKNIQGDNYRRLTLEDNPLDVLFQWGQNLNERIKIAQGERDAERQHRLSAEKQTHDVTRELETTRQRLSQAQHERSIAQRKHEDEVDKLVSQLSHEAEKYRRQHDEFARKFEHQMSNLTHDHESRIHAYNLELEKRNADHILQTQNLKATHHEETEKLVAQLLISQDSNSGWTDEKLKRHFGKLMAAIDSLSSPRRKEFQPASDQVGQELDRFNFVSRYGKGRSHVLLKSLIWATLINQFFSAPLGFGSLGSGGGKTELLRLLTSWEAFVRWKTQDSEKQDMFEIFQSNPRANAWRSALFQTVNTSLTAPEDVDGALPSSVARFHSENVKVAAERLLGLLKQFTKLSGAATPPTVDKEVFEIVRLADELAIQIGVNPARLLICVPSRNERVKIGAEYQHYQDGDTHRGSQVVVDLVVAPGLLRVGDGQMDLDVKASIVPCKLYPQ